MSGNTIGDVERVDLHIHQDSDCEFEVEWLDEFDTPVPIASADGGVYRAQDEQVVDLTPYITVMPAPDNHVLAVFIPASDTVTFEPVVRGIWELSANSVVGTRKKLGRGNVWIHREVHK